MLNAAPVSEIPLTIHWHYCQSKSLSSKWICVEHYFPHTSGIIAVVSTHFQDDQVRLIHLGRFDLFFFLLLLSAVISFTKLRWVWHSNVHLRGKSKNFPLSSDISKHTIEAFLWGNRYLIIMMPAAFLLLVICLSCLPFLKRILSI